MKPRALPIGAAARTVLARIAPAIDNARQVATEIGARPYQVFLVWGTWGGRERGEGDFGEVARVQLLPNPKVETMQFTSTPYSAGQLPVGAVRVSGISTSYAQPVLQGDELPNGQRFDKQKRTNEFFFEVVQDDRHETINPERARMRLLSGPVLIPTRVSWEMQLERSSEDRTNREARIDRANGRGC
jgi:hypothetical protein